MSDSTEHRLLICMPQNKDARLASQALGSAGFTSFICKDVADLLHELEGGAGAVISVEEALTTGAIAAVSKYLATQPAWSDMPILVLTKPGGESPWISRAYERLGNLTFLERPVRRSTLISAARSALRARKRQYEIRQVDQRKDEFLAMLAHELRNPLAPICAAAELLEFVSHDADKVRQCSEIINRQIGHMTNLIDDLLDVARVTRGMVSLDKERLDFLDILSEAEEQVTPLISARKHRLVRQLPLGPVPVIGDRKRLIQVVVNVLNNAAKYTPDGGQLTVRLELSSEEAVLEVSDNGIGMEPDMVSRVFDLFAQAERSSDRSQGGLGLGLALVRSLIGSHGGRVSANSGGIGKGSTFTLHLPLLPNDTAATAEKVTPAEAVQPASRPLRVLVVDDNVDACSMLKMFLEAMGHDVSVESTGLGGVTRAQAISPQVCLLDIGLPDIDGYELARRLRVHPATASAVLIAITGYGQDEDRRNAYSAGFDHHFIKPLDGMKLASFLAELSVGEHKTDS